MCVKYKVIKRKKNSDGGKKTSNKKKWENNVIKVYFKQTKYTTKEEATILAGMIGTIVTISVV